MTGAGAVTNTARVGPGQSVAVFGAGGVGLCAIQAAHNVGADPIIAIDLDQSKLAFARRFGATHTVNAATGDPVAEVRSIAGDGVDFAFDTIGAPDTVRQIVTATRRASPGCAGAARRFWSASACRRPCSICRTSWGAARPSWAAWAATRCPTGTSPFGWNGRRRGAFPSTPSSPGATGSTRSTRRSTTWTHGRISGRAIFEMGKG